MGQDLIDDDGVDFRPGSRQPGLGLLPVVTHFQGEKAVSQVTARGSHPLLLDMPVDGYEIHLGRTEIVAADVQPLWRLAADAASEHADGAATADLRRAGSYLHNVFHNDNFRTLWLNEIRRAKGLAERPLVDTQAQKEIQYERLAAYARKYLDIDYIMSIIKKEI